MPLPKEVELRVMPGLYYHRITEASAARFFEDTWTVAPEADRIGYRYRNGRPLEFCPRRQPFGAGSDPSNIVDAGYPYGSIQVPGGVEPIILHRDAVSGGGYAMIGTVISADMDRIAQMQPNYKTSFVKVDLGTALTARADHHPRNTAPATPPPRAHRARGSPAAARPVARGVAVTRNRQGGDIVEHSLRVFLAMAEPLQRAFRAPATGHRP